MLITIEFYAFICHKLLGLCFCNCHIIITCNNLEFCYFFCIFRIFLLFLYEFQNFFYFYVIFQFYVFCQYLHMNAPAFYMNCHWTQIVTDICCMHLNEITWWRKDWRGYSLFTSVSLMLLLKYPDKNFTLSFFIRKNSSVPRR